MDKQIKLLSIDNASKTSGWAFFYGKQLHDYGTIFIPGKLADDRLLQYFKDMRALLRHWKPDIVIIESPYICRGNAGPVLFQFFGVLKLLCKLLKINYGTMTAPHAKQGLTGAGNASKEAIITDVICIYDEYLKDVPLLEDEADAIAIGYTYVNQ